MDDKMDPETPVASKLPEADLSTKEENNDPSDVVEPKVSREKEEDNATPGQEAAAPEIPGTDAPPPPPIEDIKGKEEEELKPKDSLVEATKQETMEESNAHDPIVAPSVASEVVDNAVGLECAPPAETVGGDDKETNVKSNDTIESPANQRPTRAARVRSEWKEAAVASAVKHKKNGAAVAASASSKERLSLAPSSKKDAAAENPTTAVNSSAHVGMIVERNKMNPQGQLQAMIGTIQEYREAERRIPPRWAVHWSCPTTTTTTTAPNGHDDNLILGEEWVEADLPPLEENTDASVPAGATSAMTVTTYQPSTPLPLELIQQRFDDILTHQLEEQQVEYTVNLLPSLILFAALEEALQTLLEQNSLQDHYTPSTTATTKTASRATAQAHPPMYYSANPTSYLQPPSMDAFSSSVTSKGNSTQQQQVVVAMTPSALAQRVRSGCQWAWDYLQWQQPLAPPPPMTLGIAGLARRSLRQPKPIVTASVPVPVPVQKGGRVAMWWLEALKEQQRKTHVGNGATKEVKKDPVESSIKSEVDSKGPVNVAKSPSKRATDSTQKPQPVGDGMEVDHPNDDEDDDDNDGDANKTDEDFDPADTGGEEEDDDDNLDDVELERNKLSPVSSPTKDTDEEEESEEQEEESVDEDSAIEYNNPYMQPTFTSFLEYMVRPKSLTAAEIQTALCECLLKVKHNKRTVNFGLPVSELESVDHVVLDRATPDYPPSGTMALECVSGETFAELQKLDPQAFARCKFTISVLGEQEISRKIQLEQEFHLKEAEYKQQKVWDRWRFKGIHEGYAQWPSWEESVLEWLSQAMGTNMTESKAPSAADMVSAVIAPPEQSNDMALAKSLEENESSGRRRTRRAATSGGMEGVFYGNQSQMTQKQLMDTLVRLVRTNHFQTLIRFQSLVADDSANPLRRARIALGKLVWKRNQLVRKSATTELSDAVLLELLSKKPLVEVQKPIPVLKPRPATTTSTMEDPDPIAEEPKEEAAVPQVNEEQKTLVQYLQSLHYTELQLRSLVLKYLADIPTAIIATAADERAGTMESMDDADFEDMSSIEWHTSGHELLQQVIYRPAETQNTTDTTPCRWFKIKDYTPSIKSTSEEAPEAVAADESVREPMIVERRIRFRAVPMRSDDTSTTANEARMMILTEAQVRAGMKASEVEQQQNAAAGKSSSGHPFLAGIGARITLIPFESDSSDDDDARIDGQVMGHDTAVGEDDEADVEYRILILPERGGSLKKKAFWATLDVRADDSTLLCSPVDDETGCMYTIEQCDYHSGSTAFQECWKIIEWLRRQKNAGPFLEPVDPIALNVPTYHQVIKNPMDISTLEEKLQNGHYSRIPSGQSEWQTPASRMLNGPFRKDVELIFDNALLFNPPNDWIHQIALQLKKTSSKRIADASYAADHKQQTSGSGSRRSRAQKKSVYVDEDSDVDMYEYESDNDDDFEASGRKTRKRKKSQRGGGNKDDLASRAIEQSIRLQTIMRDALDLRGPLSNLPVNSDASSFTMPPDWSCRRTTNLYAVKTNGKDDSKEDPGNQSEEEVEDEQTLLRKKRAQEVAELLELHREYEANESAGLRRSARAPLPESSTKASKASSSREAEYFLLEGTIIGDDEAHNKGSGEPPSTRLELEMERERMHEQVYAKLYQKYANLLVSSTRDDLTKRRGSQTFGLYTNGSFPPFLGRVVPLSGWTDVSWEIRAPFVIPALRWILRGLIHSGHVTAVEPLDTSANSGVVMTNDIYFYDAKLQPFDELDLKELQRRKRVDKAEEAESEDEIELSEYEKLRAERVARNAERLKALGLG
jgi:hypothetical protein